MSREPALDTIADAILDGTAIDWTGVDADGAPMDEALIEQLKTLAMLRQMPRQGQSPQRVTRGNWGHLQLLEPIGQGAYGDVYRAWDTRLDREVALKLLAADAQGAGTSDSHVIHEGRLLARVRHPNVVTIYGAERIDGRIGLWMEFIKGRTLEEAIREGQTFTTADVARLGVELCGAVSTVHGAGLLHRDIKAQNLMLDEHGRLVLMDFGAGRELGDSTELRAPGTPLYLAPEVLAGEAATVRSDVYSVGVVLFRLATKSYPVLGADLEDLRRAHTIDGGVDVRLDRREIPARLRRVLARAIDPDPDRRYAGADALGEALATVARAPMLTRLTHVAAGVAALVAALAAGWSFGLRESFVPPPAALATAEKTPTIAVLPFRNASSDPGNDDFIDGLTSEVIRNLAVVDGLQVRSQTSSFFFKDRPRDLREVASQLQADLIVEASVQRVGNRLRISAQLVQIPDDVPLWAERFDRTVDDVFAIQDEISLAIVNKLRLTLGRSQRRYQTSVAAYDLYLRARALVARRGTVNAKEAARLFERVIALDSEYAPAYAGLVDAYAAMSWQIVDGLSNEEGLDGMRPAALKALQLDPELAEAHAGMGQTYARELEWDKARSSFDRALQLNPNLSEIRTNYAWSTLLPQGDTAKALEILAVAMKSDPFSLAVKRDVAAAYLLAGRYEEAVRIFQEVIADDAEFTFAANLLARSLTFAGRPREAIELWESRRWPGDWERWLMPAYVQQRRRADIERLRKDPLNGDQYPYRQALIHAALGDKDRTFEALNRAAVVIPQRTAPVLVYPEMALLRGDPRLEQLRERLNLR